MQPEIYERMAAVEGTHWWFVARRRILSTVLARLPLPERARILEAGCGTGGNLQMLSGFGRVAGFDPDSDARACADRGTGGPLMPIPM